MKHRFVEYIPEELEDGVLYVSMEYATASHNCCCGCGMEVVTPFSPTDWKLSYDGVAVSLSPSIGNWSFPCRSHYWIRQNSVEWAAQWSMDSVEEGRKADRLAKAEYFRHMPESPKQQETAPRIKLRMRLWSLLKSYLGLN